PGPGVCTPEALARCRIVPGDGRFVDDENLTASGEGGEDGRGVRNLIGSAASLFIFRFPLEPAGFGVKCDEAFGLAARSAAGNDDEVIDDQRRGGAAPLHERLVLAG